MDSLSRQELFSQRAHHPRSEAAVFMENSIFIPGQQAPVFVDRVNRFSTIEEGFAEERIDAALWQQVDDEKNELFALMEQVRSRIDKKHTGGVQPVQSNLRQCTWSQVMGEVQETAARWSTTPKRTSNLMVCLDKLGRNSDAFHTWLQLLPGGDYGSSLCGVFAISISAAGHFTKTKDYVIEALARIPEIFEGARRYTEIYSQMRDQHLVRKTFDLFRATLRALTHILRFFDDSSFRKFYQPLIQQSSYKEELHASIKEIETQADRVKEEAGLCFQKRVGDQNSIIQGTHENSSQTLNILQKLYKQLLEDQELRKANLVYTTQEALVTPDPKATRLTLESSKHAMPASGESKDSTVGAAKLLLNILQYDSDVASTDMERCLRLGDAMDEHGKARSAALIRHQIFKRYMTEDSSSAPLLVNGNEDLSAAEGISPLSVVGARLCRVSEQTKSTFVLKYFCGEHGPYSNNSIGSSPTGMLASIIGQLIDEMLVKEIPIDLSFLKQVRMEDVRRMKLTSLDTILKELVGQLPPESVLLCIIDEVSAYETRLLRDDIQAIFRRLARLVKHTHHIAFKLLVTCRGQARGISQYFAGHTLNLDETVETQDSSGWYIANMAKQV